MRREEGGKRRENRNYMRETRREIISQVCSPFSFLSPPSSP
jgi:hypothetical protein